MMREIDLWCLDLVKDGEKEKLSNKLEKMMMHVSFLKTWLFLLSLSSSVSANKCIIGYGLKD